MPVTIQTRGFREAERNLVNLAREFGPRGTRTLINRELRSAFRPVADEIRSNTPVDTGGLRDSVSLRVGAPTRRDRRNPEVGPNVFAIARAGWFWRGTSLWFQSINVEYGNSQQAPHNILRSALENNANTVLTNLATGLGEAIERAGTVRRRR